MNFEELTPDVRRFMVSEFEAEQNAAFRMPYRPKVLTPAGEAGFRQTMIEHLSNGTELTLMRAMSPSYLWVERGIRNTKKGPVSYFLSAENRAKVFAITDFNTWYVRGLCKQLMLEGIEDCEVYRTASAYEPRGECLLLEGQRLRVKDIYEGHRRRYHPEASKDPYALSIPVGPNCHHSIRRRERDAARRITV